MAGRADKHTSDHPITHVETPALSNISLETITNNKSTHSLSTTSLNESYKPVYVQKSVNIKLKSPSFNSSLKSEEKHLNGLTVSTEIIQINVDDDNLTKLDEHIEALEKDEIKHTYEEYTDDDLNEALRLSHNEEELNDHSEIEKLSMVPLVSDHQNENHYMPMTPKKGSISKEDIIIAPLDILSSIINSVDNAEENAYIEMTKASCRSSLTIDTKSSYEHLNIQKTVNKKEIFEPLYMELSSNAKKTDEQVRLLPDLLLQNLSLINIHSNDITNFKHSKVDDWTIGTNKSKKRFSLSDVYRPASYYLSTVNESSKENQIMESSCDVFNHNRNTTGRRQKNRSFDISSSNNISTVSKNNNTEKHYNSSSNIFDNFVKIESVNKHFESSIRYGFFNAKAEVSNAKSSLPEDILLNSTLMEIEQMKRVDSFSGLQPDNKQSIDSIGIDIGLVRPPDNFDTSWTAIENNTLEKAYQVTNHLEQIYYDSLEDVTNIDTNNLETLNENDFSTSESISSSSTFLNNSNIPNISDSASTSSNHNRHGSTLSDTAPYYYSDIRHTEKINASYTNYNCKLNNLKDVNIRKTGISHIHNPISYKDIVADINPEQCYSKELIDLSEKINDVNVKNLFEYDGNKTQKNVEKGTDQILFLKQTKSRELDKMSNLKIADMAPCTSGVTGEHMWEEDYLWRENLRRVSQRHTKSLDALDQISEPSRKESVGQKQRSKPSREVKYVNDLLPEKEKLMKINNQSNKLNTELESNSDEADDVYVQLAVTDDSDVYETLREDDMDREKIRQWDLMSSTGKF